MKSFNKGIVDYKYIGVIIIVVMRLLHEPYRWAQSQYEWKWEHSGELTKWWLFSGAYFVAEYLVFLVLVALLAKRSQSRLFSREFAFIAADLAAVFFLLSLGGVMSVDPILSRALESINLQYASMVMYGLAAGWFCLFVYRLRVMSHNRA
jgi:hypothetical protein